MSRAAANIKPYIRSKAFIYKKSAYFQTENL